MARATALLALISLVIAVLALQISTSLQREGLKLQQFSGESAIVLEDPDEFMEFLELDNCRFLPMYLVFSNTGGRGVSISGLSVSSESALLTLSVAIDRVTLVGAEQAGFPHLQHFTPPHYIRPGEQGILRIPVDLGESFLAGVGGPDRLEVDCQDDRAYSELCPDEDRDGVTLTITHTFDSTDVVWSCGDIGAVLA